MNTLLSILTLTLLSTATIFALFKTDPTYSTKNPITKLKNESKINQYNLEGTTLHISKTKTSITSKNIPPQKNS